MASGRLADYLGKGDVLDRPATLDLHPEAVGVYFAEDTGEWSAWDGVQWIEDIMGGGGGISDAPSDGSLYGRKDGDWEVVPAVSNEITIITESSAFDVDPATHSGRHRLILAGGDVTFDVSEGYAAGNVFSIVATAAIELITTGVTLTPPAGGTLDLSADMAVSIVMTSSSAGRIIGQTVPA